MAQPQYRIKQTINRDATTYEAQRQIMKIWFTIPVWKPEKFNSIFDTRKFISYYEMMRSNSNINYFEVNSISEYDPDKKLP